MKKILFMSLVAATVFACTPKATPTATTTAPAAESSTTAAPAGTTTASAGKATLEAGHTIYTSKCSRCHALKEVSNYTAERWVPILKNMAPKARLTEEETAQVLAYVQANAKKA